MFRSDLDFQSQKLMDTLALAIASLRDLPSLMATLEALALRHVDYGVRDEHYDHVGAALLWTLERTLANAGQGAPVEWVGALGIAHAGRSAPLPHFPITYSAYHRMR
jgi:hemoglobin-like flavoprotein